MPHFPTLTTAANDTPLGSWEMRDYTPPEWLTPFVHRYQGYVEHPLGVLRRCELASAEVVLILNLGAPLFVHDPRFGPPVLHQSFLSGLYDAFVFTQTQHIACGVQINLTPLGAYALLGQMPMHLLVNRTVAIEDLLGPPARRLIDQMREAPSWEHCFALLDTFIASCLTVEHPSSSGVDWAWQQLQVTNGKIAIRTLTETLGWSRKQLVARFREQIGLPPKIVARLLRFQHVIAALKQGPITWAELATRGGYYDQSHLIKDFHQFAGSSPALLLQRFLPDGGGVSGDETGTFFQDNASSMLIE